MNYPRPFCDCLQYADLGPLLECDRSFTRSDALAKHLRTVHETDNLKPSDPVPKGHSSTQKPQRLKLVFNSKPPSSENQETLSSPHPTNIKDEEAEGEEEDDDATLPRTGSPSPMPEDLDWTDAELKLTPYELFRKLRREVYWAEHDVAGELKAESERLEMKKVEEWQRKELVFYNWWEAELALAVRRGADLSVIEKIQEDLPHPMLPLTGPTPWYRHVFSDEDQQTTKDEVGKWVEGVGDHGQDRERLAEV